jgi:hypothetical protein
MNLQPSPSGPKPIAHRSHSDPYDPQMTQMFADRRESDSMETTRKPCLNWESFILHLR